MILNSASFVAGTMSAACKLIDAVKVETVECIVIIELADLQGRKNVPQKLHSFVKY